VRKAREGELTCALFGFLTTEANATVGACHPKAMPVILTTPDAWDLWLSDASWDAVRHLQRSLPNDALEVVARDVPMDETAAA
jgi:putative SOS response-associated peptidase YedK